MDLIHPELQPLQKAESGSFLQTLLREFDVESIPNGGLQLELKLDAESPSFSRAGLKGPLAQPFDFDEGRRAATVFSDLRSAAVGTRESFRLERFWFRHASAGVLPQIPGESERDALLFFRDIAPIGWNIANGASGSLTEMTAIESLMLRECSEELLFFDPTRAELLTLSPVEAGSELERSVKLWSQKLGVERQGQLELSFENGPDRLLAQGCSGETVQIDGLHLSLQAEDFGIECSRFATVETGTRPLIPLDGELAGGCLLDRPIGQFSGIPDEDHPDPISVFQGGRLCGTRPQIIEPRLCPVTRALSRTDFSR